MVYESDSSWIAPLTLERRQALASDHPFFRHAEWQAWVAYDGATPVGRISAQVDALHQERYHDHTGHFGMLEAIDDGSLFATLFDAAERWLVERGMQRATGPFNLNVNQEIGLLVEGFDTPPYFMMGHARPYYCARVESCGYRPAKDLLAY
ncbi:MAG: N-acetyltransferase, partial [Gammaproteobacteria bacterium]